jgi:signal transduction histidine kinase
MTPAVIALIVWHVLGALRNWVTRDNPWGPRGGATPPEVVFLRLVGLAYLVLFVVITIGTRPHPGLSDRGLAVLIALVAFVAAAIACQPRRETSVRSRIVALLGLTAASATLAAVQPNGIWEAGPYLVGIVAAMRLDRRPAVLTLAVSLVVILATAIAAGRGGAGVSVLVGAVPWFLVMRMMREMRLQHTALEASQAAEARAAAAAERGRLAREMHDVLAHSLSALALQLETTRLLARERNADPDITRALDQAHHLAAGGLEEARRAIATARGDELPGPERLPALTEAFGEMSDLPVSLEVTGEPRELPPDARLAVYRTAQEALTNIRRHATADRVEVQLEYREDAAVLRVEDHAHDGAPPAPVAEARHGYGLTGMRERAELLGGSLTAQPTSDGFRVELRLPFSSGRPACAER